MAPLEPLFAKDLPVTNCIAPPMPDSDVPDVISIIPEFIPLPEYMAMCPVCAIDVVPDAISMLPDDPAEEADKILSSKEVAIGDMKDPY